MDAKDFSNINSEIFKKAENAINNQQARIAEEITARAEYNSAKDGAIFETRNLLRQMHEDSKKESIIQKKRFIIQTVIAVVALIASVVAATAALIPLL